jgi:hypothetical protein
MLTVSIRLDEQHVHVRRFSQVHRPLMRKAHFVFSKETWAFHRPSAL